MAKNIAAETRSHQAIRDIDAEAIPLIAELGLEGAYRRAFDTADAPKRAKLARQETLFNDRNLSGID